MTTRRTMKVVAAFGLAGMIATACSSDAKKAATTAASTGTGTCANATAPKGDKVTLQLQWFAQSQFGGYYAAVDQGFFKDAGIDVTIAEGSVSIVPADQITNGSADFAISWVPKALASREAGAKIVNIGQIFQRSGTLQVSLKDKNITKPADFKGKKIGNWGFGNEYEIFAALAKDKLDPAKDVTLVGQNFDMNGLLSGEIDAAEAMIYNEYAQVLEAKNEKTGKLYTADDLNVISYEQAGVGMLQDAIWANETKLTDPAYCGKAVALLKGAIKGWAYCRDNAAKCRDIVVSKGSKLGAGHQLWQMNEVNGLIWPSANGAGMIDSAAWDRTVGIASGTKNLEGKTVLTKAPDATAYTNDLVKMALADLDKAGVDTKGANFKKATVEVTAGGA